MSGENVIPCPICDHPGCAVKKGARGGFSMSCAKCGYQGFCRTPAAAEAIRAKLGAGPAPSKEPKQGGGGSFLDQL